jgi:lactoylglutathione lyase
MRKTAGKTKIGITITKTAFLFSLALVLPGSLLFSQASAASRPELDHTTVFVRDIQKSVDFYEKVVGLEKIPDPFKDGKHIWFRSGAHQQLHVVAGATEAAQHDIEIHTAFRVASLTDFMTHLDQMQVKYRNFKGDGKISARPDGVRQIYFQDPDGYWIEVNEDKY